MYIKECQTSDRKNHRKDCKAVKHYLDMFPEIEEKFVNWKWSEHRYYAVVDENVPHKIRYGNIRKF